MKRDVFLSYRRSDGVYPAYQFYHDLCDANYSVFFDMKSMRSGMFPDQLRQAIKDCIDFVLLVTNDVFSERIFEDEDWIRIEIKEALNLRKNIIVLFVGDVRFPEKLPDDINDIRYAQSISQIDPTALSEIHNKIFATYLKTKPINKVLEARRMRCSVYDAEYGNESQRLYVQSLANLDFDLSVLNEVLVTRDKVAVLDAGCAQGYVTESRFSDNRYVTVYGIDKNDGALNKAKSRIANDKFNFFIADIESDGFVSLVKSEMFNQGLSGFDVIFCSYVLHHLAHPIRAVKKLRELLNPGGYLIIRGSDDGSKYASGDDNLVEAIINKTYAAEGMSDRKNGRKIYSWLYSGGFHDIKMHFNIVDTSSLGYDERINLFMESFSYRVNYFRKKYEADQTEESWQDFDEMEKMLICLEEKFTASDFWYTETTIIGVGRR